MIPDESLNIDVAGILWRSKRCT